MTAETNETLVETEAELQARLEERIRRALPLLPAKIKLEHQIHLRLGHRKIIIDDFATDKDGTRGRYDLLVLSNGKPLLMVELKDPEIAVGEEDLQQVISYARLHQPMVPLVLVTNGRDILLRRTYDGAELQASDIAANRLGSILASAATLAASESENAVSTLLGASPDIWAQILSAWSKEAINALTGSVLDFKQPIARELTFERQAAKQVADRLVNGDRILVVHGPPLSGVTNVLAQLCLNTTIGPSLFIDGKANPDILQFIANRLSRELSFGISKDDLRGWLNTGRGLLDITLIVDGLPQNGVDELIENANAGLLRLVFGMDSETFRRCSTIPGRSQKSQMGRTAVGIELKPLSDEEFQTALDVFDRTCGALFFNGAQHSPQLRWPRALRVIAATLPVKIASSSKGDGRVSKLMLPPIPGPMSLDACNRAFVTEPSLKFDLQKLAQAYLKDVDQYASDPDWLVATWGRPSIDPGLLERTLGAARSERLRAQGFLSWIDTRELGPRVLVRVEELLNHYVAEEWSASLQKHTDHGAIAAEIERLVRISATIPAGDVVLAAALIRIIKKNQDVLGVAIPLLVKCEPTTSRLKEGARVELLVKDARIRLHFGEGMNEEVVKNIQPWLVLSHLSSWPMAIEGYEATANFSIFMTLGISRHLLLRPPPAELAQMTGFHFHDIEGIGTIPCLKTGIVEPLLQAMLGHAHSHPDELIMLGKLAMKEKEVHLAWRVLTVALASETSTDDAVRRAATEIAEVLKDWWGDALKASLQRHQGKNAP